MSKKSLPTDEVPVPKVGRPSSYRDQFPEMLMRHMAQGNGFKSFAAVVGVNADTLYSWVARHEDFADAKTKGDCLSLKFYEDMGKLIGMGQTKRIQSEEPVLDSAGKPVLDPNTGQVLMKRTYAPTQGNAAIWIFTMKNMHGWRDQRNVAVSGDGYGGAIPMRINEPDSEEKMKEIIEVTKVLKELEDGTADAIEITD